MNFKHGMRETKLYGVWAAMLSRCHNPNVKAYANYGARGIFVCDRWHNFANFWHDMGNPPPGMSLDRIDNDGPYSQANCQWATRQEQSRNRRNIKPVEANGRTMTLAEWSAESGIALSTIWARINKGWPPEIAVTHPIVKTRANAKSGIPAYAFGTQQGVDFEDGQ